MNPPAGRRTGPDAGRCRSGDASGRCRARANRCAHHSDDQRAGRCRSGDASGRRCARGNPRAGRWSGPDAGHRRDAVVSGHPCGRANRRAGRSGGPDAGRRRDAVVFGHRCGRANPRVRQRDGRVSGHRRAGGGGAYRRVSRQRGRTADWTDDWTADRDRRYGVSRSWNRTSCVCRNRSLRGCRRAVGKGRQAGAWELTGSCDHFWSCRKMTQISHDHKLFSLRFRQVSTKQYGIINRLSLLRHFRQTSGTANPPPVFFLLE